MYPVSRGQECEGRGGDISSEREFCCYRDRFNAGEFIFYIGLSVVDGLVLEGDVDLLGSDEYWDPHAIAGLLKSSLHELPASILTRELHMKFLAVMGVSYISNSCHSYSPFL